MVEKNIQIINLQLTEIAIVIAQACFTTSNGMCGMAL